MRVGIEKRRFPGLNEGLRTHLGNSLIIIAAVTALHHFEMIERERKMTDVDLDDDDGEPKEPAGAGYRPKCHLRYDQPQSNDAHSRERLWYTRCG